MTHQKRRKSTSRPCSPKLLFFPLAFLSLDFAYWHARVASYQPASTVPEPKDCAIVLGAATRNGKPTPDFQRRLQHTLSLFRQGLVEVIITTGDHTPDEPYSCAETAARWLVHYGVPPEAIYLEPDSRFTFENIAFSKRIMRQLGLQSCALISEPLHLTRAKQMADYYGLLAAPTASVSSYEGTSRQRMIRREAYFCVQFQLKRLFNKPDLTTARLRPKRSDRPHSVLAD